MKARQKLCWLAAILAVVVIIFLLRPAPPKPKTYQGKTIEEWVTLLNMNVDFQKEREQAGRALELIGTNALPDLERILSRRPNRFRETVERYAIRLHLMKRPPPPAVHPLEMQSRACEAAYRLGEFANIDISRLVPHLRYHFTNGTYADSNSSRALAHAGPTGIATLTNLLFTGSRNVRDQSGWALASVSRKPEVYTMLIAAANFEKDPGMQANLLLYLDRSEAPAELVVPLGLKAYRNGNAYKQWTALSLLRNYVGLPEVRAVFEEGRTNNDARVRSTAERVLANP
jgi:hypothetical protein